MPTGPEGQKRPADPVASALAVAKIATREQDEELVAMRRQHPAVESAIDNLEHRPGLSPRSRWLCPRDGAFHRGLQHPPHWPADNTA